MKNQRLIIVDNWRLCLRKVGFRQQNLSAVDLQIVGGVALCVVHPHPLIAAGAGAGIGKAGVGDLADSQPQPRGVHSHHAEAAVALDISGACHDAIGDALAGLTLLRVTPPPGRSLQFEPIS